MRRLVSDDLPPEHIANTVAIHSYYISTLVYLESSAGPQIYLIIFFYIKYPIGSVAQKQILNPKRPKHIVNAMMTHADTAGNAKKVAQLQTAWAELLAETLKRGFHGTARVEVSIQDGTIQHIRRRVERIEK
jgi:hypothetical protein